MKYNNRASVPEQYKWDLSRLFSTDEDWSCALKAFSGNMHVLSDYAGKLGDPAVLCEYFELSDKLGLEFETIYVYANMKSHEDMRIGQYQQAVSSIDCVMSEFLGIIAFAVPEIISAYTVEQLIALSKEKRFAAHSYDLTELARKKDTILSEKEEKLLAQASTVFGTFQDTFMRFDNADIKWDKVDVKGRKVKLSHGVYGELMQSKNRNVRRAAHFAMFKGYKDMINTIACNYAGNVQSDVFLARVRGFSSCLEYSLDSDNIPTKVYNNLLQEVHNAIPTLRKYLAYRGKKLGVSAHRAYDMYVPVENVDCSSYDFDAAFELVLKGLAPLGEDYVALLKQAREQRWIDVYETEGKRSGGYSWGVYGHPPYILLNFNGTLNEVFTVAHELGHSLHSYYSDNALPYNSAQYKIFVAEIASTVNETLLIRYLLKNSPPERKKYLLTYVLDMFKATVFRQTMFAEFEKQAHEVVEGGNGLSPESLCAIYKQLNLQYYGSNFITPVIQYEWARIPHFYNSFYVYKYATGLISATAIANDILSGKPGAVENYKRFLSAGGSMPPLEILKLAGVDLCSEEPFKKAFALFADTLEELKSL